MKKKALVLGDYEHAPYHPFRAVDKEFEEILSARYDVRLTGDYEELKADGLRDCDLCVSYTDRWEGTISDEQTAGLLGFVAGGGGLLIVHNGISLQNRPEFVQLAGGKFIGHPPMRELTIRSTPDSGIIAGTETFTVEDEPYRFEFDPFAKVTVLLEYEDEEGTWPAAWSRVFGLGRIVYLMPGHHLPSFQNETYRRIIAQSARWAAGEEDADAAGR